MPYTAAMQAARLSVAHFDGVVAHVWASTKSGRTRSRKAYPSPSSGTQAIRRLV